jgi:Arc/MetJ-type ribon-helix-helix transcriptional regulator
MTRRGYRSIMIPSSMYQRLQAYVQTSDGHYVTIAEVVREALRAYLPKTKSDASD